MLPNLLTCYSGPYFLKMFPFNLVEHKSLLNVSRALLSVRSRYGMLDDGARFHVISHLIRETVNFGKSILATSIAGRDGSSNLGSSSKEGSIHSLIQKDRVLTAVSPSFEIFQLSKHKEKCLTFIHGFIASFM